MEGGGGGGGEGKMVKGPGGDAGMIKFGLVTSNKETAGTGMK